MTGAAGDLSILKGNRKNKTGFVRFSWPSFKNSKCKSAKKSSIQILKLNVIKRELKIYQSVGSTLE